MWQFYGFLANVNQNYILLALLCECKLLRCWMSIVVLWERLLLFLLFYCTLLPFVSSWLNFKGLSMLSIYLSDEFSFFKYHVTSRPIGLYSWHTFSLAIGVIINLFLVFFLLQMDKKLSTELSAKWKSWNDRFEITLLDTTTFLLSTTVVNSDQLPRHT